MNAKARFGIAAASIALMISADMPAQSQTDFKRQRAQRSSPHPSQKAATPLAGQFGSPLPGLTADQLADFEEGRDEFQNEDTVASGLGPTFNDISCAACHFEGAIGGGGSARFVTRFGRVRDGKFDPLAESGGSLLQANAIHPDAQELVPKDANVVAQRRTTPLFGLGLIEAIPDSEIILRALSRKADGVVGRAAIIQDVTTGQTRVGRLGWKAQQATILAFAADAYLNEMGITSRFFPQENAPNGNAALLAKFDSVADPEDAVDPATGRSDIDAFADFMRLLAPPTPLELTEGGRSGRTLFASTGCAACHTPVLHTDYNKIRALDRKPVRLYSDLLLHRMGSLGDGIAQADAAPDEFRTPPLWGLRAVTAYLHDGRAKTVDEAIRLHDGEAASARGLYIGLTSAQRAQLIEFLNSI